MTSWSAAGDRHEKPITLLSGITAKVADPSKVLYAKGASYEFNSQDMSFAAEAGEFDLFIGTSSQNLQKSAFTLSENHNL